MDQHEIVKAAFARQAAGFGARGLTLSREDHLAWMVATLAPAAGARVLDVAGGTGHLARALAPRVREVTVIDLTPEMLAEGRRAAAAAGLGNVAFLEGRAEALPFADSDFDLVACRFAIHHLAEPLPVVREMVRVCRPGGRVALIDLTAPAAPDLARSYDRIERLRDPSHCRALPPAELEGLLVAAGLTSVASTRREVEVELGPWAALTGTPPEILEQIRSELRAELAGGAATGMRPFDRDGTLMFRQTWQISLGIRPA
jgi:ubiquinone/menaquinone biosynthesis C-methylase UbiE